MRAYSRILLGRAIAGAVVFSGLIGFAIYWHRTQVVQPEQAVYRPAQRIVQVLAANQALRQSGPNDTLVPDQGLPCEGRPLDLLRARLLASGAVALEQLEQRIRAAAASQPPWPNCASFAQAFELALAMSAGQVDGADLSARQVEQALSEDVSWTRRLPCLLARDADTVRLLTGSPMVCGGAAPTLDSLASIPREASYRQLSASLARGVSVAAVAGTLQVDRLGWLSLSPGLQGLMDTWALCRQAGQCPQLPALQAQRDVSVVVMDANTGLILAAWCDGQACSKMARAGAGILPAALVEAPPASTAKLLFSLELAAAQVVEPLLLQRQIKTSGQNDALVVKRNEWWERQAICDAGDTQACDVPGQTRRLAEALGYNAACDRGAALCGRWGLVMPELRSLSPGTVGRLALEPTGAKRVRMLDWKSYEAVRQGRKSPKGLVGYEPSSRAIQAVLGAGDSRTSALGLALLSTQIWRMAQGLPPAAPRVIDFGPTDLPTRWQADARWQSAASTVLGGMRKVVEPPEAGWLGPGTAAPALEQALKRPCLGDCGLWAKTGTVSRQDKVYGGTTVLTGLVDTRALSAWSGKPVMGPSLPSMLSIGVIAMPRGGAASGHAASQIGMGLVRQLLANEAKP
jgi:hypothetical protein